MIRPLYELMFTPRELAKRYNVSRETLRLWSIEGKIQTVKTDGGHRRYVVNEEFLKGSTDKCNIIYARVSSAKQKEDLDRQIEFLKSKYPDYEVISDIGSGINFRRKGLLTILDRLIQGNIRELVVAHKDRLCRFGFELFQHLFKRQGSILTVVESSQDEDPKDELSDDLMSIITVFTARYHGKRKYKKNMDMQEDKDLSE